ncbi:hypothetical protein OFL98_24930, partial [Escherichia coli]|nr:hypothetical protein [Escherichia coli]
SNEYTSEVSRAGVVISNRVSIGNGETGGAVLIKIFGEAIIITRAVIVTDVIIVIRVIEGTSVTSSDSSSIIIVSYILASYFNNLVVY